MQCCLVGLFVSFRWPVSTQLRIGVFEAEDVVVVGVAWPFQPSFQSFEEHFQFQQPYPCDRGNKMGMVRPTDVFDVTQVSNTTISHSLGALELINLAFSHPMVRTLTINKKICPELSLIDNSMLSIPSAESHARKCCFHSQCLTPSSHSWLKFALRVLKALYSVTIRQFSEGFQYEVWCIHNNIIVTLPDDDLVLIANCQLLPTIASQLYCCLELRNGGKHVQ